MTTSANGYHSTISALQAMPTLWDRNHVSVTTLKPVPAIRNSYGLSISAFKFMWHKFSSAELTSPANRAATLFPAKRRVTFRRRVHRLVSTISVPTTASDLLDPLRDIRGARFLPHSCPQATFLLSWVEPFRYPRPRIALLKRRLLKRFFLHGRCKESAFHIPALRPWPKASLSRRRQASPMQSPFFHRQTDSVRSRSHPPH
ncbi:hypothetical protein SAMN04488052_108124 [Aquisalimonas asiatica]|uniref:Uncharacterized protein n=1 Tax=Aquisalimonas asiatica TaxID=406100 RepID=A0A1H8UXI8_9GAMM|nr:hypothetical protein SAMN04488052_108124 [Aquisalimonas asiatica]